METQPGQRLGQVLYQIGRCLPACLPACLLSNAQTDPSRLPVSLPLCCSAAPLPPPVATLDPCPGDRRHRYDVISPRHGPVASAAMRPRENKYGCLFGGSVRGPRAGAALQFPKSSFAPELFSFHILSPEIKPLRFGAVRRQHTAPLFATV